jgi:hypothetical protein
MVTKPVKVFNEAEGLWRLNRGRMGLAQRPYYETKRKPFIWKRREALRFNEESRDKYTPTAFSSSLAIIYISAFIFCIDDYDKRGKHRKSFINI